MTVLGCLVSPDAGIDEKSRGEERMSPLRWSKPGEVPPPKLRSEVLRASALADQLRPFAEAEGDMFGFYNQAWDKAMHEADRVVHGLAVIDPTHPRGFDFRALRYLDEPRLPLEEYPEARDPSLSLPGHGVLPDEGTATTSSLPCEEARSTSLLPAEPDNATPPLWHEEVEVTSQQPKDDSAAELLRLCDAISSVMYASDHGALRIYLENTVLALTCQSFKEADALAGKAMKELHEWETRSHEAWKGVHQHLLSARLLANRLDRESANDAKSDS